MSTNPTPETVPICGAKTRSPGKFSDYRCHRAPMPNGRCYLHGGKSLGGVASPRFKHGLYSKYLPKTLRKDYETIRKDHDLTELNDELGLQTLRIGKLLDSLEGDVSPPWEMIQAKWKKVAENPDSDSEAYKLALADLEKLIADGVAAAKKERAIWDELRQLIQEKTRTAGMEWGRLRDLQGLVQLDKVMVMWKGVLESIRANVTDQTLLRVIVQDVLRFMPAPSSGGLALLDTEEPVIDGTVTEEAEGGESKADTAPLEQGVE